MDAPFGGRMGAVECLTCLIIDVSHHFVVLLFIFNTWHFHIILDDGTIWLCINWIVSVHCLPSIAWASRCTAQMVRGGKNCRSTHERQSSQSELRWEVRRKGRNYRNDCTIKVTWQLTLGGQSTLNWSGNSTLSFSREQVEWCEKGNRRMNDE